MSKNIIITILTFLLLATGSIAVIASNDVIYRSSFWVNQVPTNKVDINTYNYENMSCVIVVAHTPAPQSYQSQFTEKGYGSNPAISCIKNN
jgi:hypothetical protein